MWSLGLLKTMKDPNYVVFSDAKIVVIKDMYPKAKHHFLVLPKEEISNLKKITEKDIPLLEHMHEKAKQYTSKHFPDVEFKFGYHAQPSMHRLHLHVISKDMNSDFLKNKKHWNSFTTEFFMNSTDVLRQLKSTGQIKFPTTAECEQMMKRELKCHRCNLVLPTIPKLKEHIKSHCTD